MDLGNPDILLAVEPWHILENTLHFDYISTSSGAVMPVGSGASHCQINTHMTTAHSTYDIYPFAIEATTIL